MIRIGRMNRLKVVKTVDFGIFLDGDTLGNILLPKRYVPQGAAVGNELDVFIYLDSNDDVIATTLTPKVMVGECAFLTVKEINPVGAFLDWGLPKDLLVPYNEQQKPMEADRAYVVHVFLDPHTGRITASSRLSRHLHESAYGLQLNQQVELLISGRSDLGFKTVVNDEFVGLVFFEDSPRTLLVGEKITGYVKQIRPDGKINLTVRQPANRGDAKASLASRILDDLKQHGGRSTLTDKSDPDLIFERFGVSKGNYKNALSQLYKERKILISKEEITLVE